MRCCFIILTLFPILVSAAPPDWVTTNSKIAQALKSGEREAALELLRGADHPAAATWLLKWMAAGGEGAEAAAEQLSTLRHPVVLKQMATLLASREKVLLVSPVNASDRMLLRAVSGMPVGDTARLRRLAVTAAEPVVRASALAGLCHHAKPGTPQADWILEQSKTLRDLESRKALCRGFAVLKDPRAYRLLVQGLDAEALKSEAHAALVAVSGKQLPAYAPDWQSWLATAVPASGSTDAEAAKTRRPPGSYPDFYGIALEGEGIFYILDMSGSMLRRLGDIRSEFRRSLKRIPPDTEIGAMSFPGSLAKVCNGIKPATAGWKETLAHGVERKGAGGRSPMHEGINNAFDAILAADVKIETIVLLSDGKPDEESFVEDLLRTRLGKRTLHTIAISGHSEFLERLAKTHGGQYRNGAKVRAFRLRQKMAR